VGREYCFVLLHPVRFLFIAIHGAQSIKNSSGALLQPFSQISRSPTVPKPFRVGVCGVVEADLELCCNRWCEVL